MRRLTFSMIIFLLIALPCGGAVPAGTTWEIRPAGAQANGGGFAWKTLVSATYKWTLSTHGTTEYYCEAAAGGNPSLVASGSVYVDGFYNLSATGAVGSLTAGQHAYGDNDTLGYTTLYVRLPDGADPDIKNKNWISYGAGGTDYSQQDAAQVSATDIRIVRADTTQVYRTGATKWAADHVNNLLHITAGTGFTAGWYHITVVDANNDAVLDSTAGTGGSTAGTGTVGGAFLFGGALDQEVFQAVQPSNNIWVSGANADPGSTYTQGEVISGATSTAGTVTAPIRMCGYMATRGDDCITTKRPKIDGNGNAGSWPAFWIFKNLRFTNNETYGFRLINGYNEVENCSCVNSSGTAARNAVTDTTGHCAFIGCEATSAKGVAFNAMLVSRFLHCYAHDSDRGITLGSNYISVIDCVLDSCLVAAGSYGYGIDLAASSDGTITGNVFYNCTAGIHGTTGTAVVVGNILSDCIDGVICTTATWNNLYDYNVWYNSATGEDVHGFSAVKGPHDITANPLMTDPANGDFTLQAGSPALDALNLTGVRNGLTGSYKWNIGVDQDDNVAGGSGGGSTFGSVIQ
jgi:hypothetical protein